MYERKKPEPPACPHNPGVVCRGQKGCDRCGWSPEVEKKRKQVQGGIAKN